jgi:hypothetical protein
MKKILSIMAIITALSSFVNAEVVTGLQYSMSKNTLESELGSLGVNERTNDSTSIKVNYGFGSKLSFMQVYVDFETYDKGVFEAAYDQYLEYGLEYTKGFEIKNDIAPYIKLGFGVGSVDAQNLSGNMEEVTAFSGKVGVGVMYSFSIFDIHAGLDYKYKKWEDIEYASPINLTLETNEKSTKMYVGFNLHL